MLSVSVVIPSIDRGVQLRSTVNQVLQQPFSDFDVWVIDQSSKQEAEVNRRHFRELNDQRLTYLHVARKGLPNARNEALARICNDIVLFVDDDIIILCDDFIRAHVRCYEDPNVGGVTGRHVERFLKMNSRRTACHVSIGGRTVFNLFGLERQEVKSCKGSNMSFRMEAVRQVGGFDRRTNLLEDTDFSVRVASAGWRLLFEPTAEVLHLSTPSGGVREKPGLMTEVSRFKSTAYYVGKHRSVAGVIAFLMTFFIIALARAHRYGNFANVKTLLKAAMDGLSEARKGPDQVCHFQILGSSNTMGSVATSPGTVKLSSDKVLG